MVTRERSLDSERARAIVRAMRRSVARRGTERSTFDRVAREAGVSRGLLHYYFGTKERLLVEVVRHDCELRMAVLERSLRDATNAEQLIAALVRNLQEWLDEDPDFSTLVFELWVLARRTPELGLEFATLLRRMRALLSELLAVKQQEGVLRADRPPGVVADVLLALADGLALRILGEPERDYSGTLEAAAGCVRVLFVQAA